jgi:hypothetical protein
MFHKIAVFKKVLQEIAMLGVEQNNMIKYELGHINPTNSYHIERCVEKLSMNCN